MANFGLFAYNLLVRSTLVQRSPVTDELIEEGGVTSGNFGHKGVPKKHGGSKPGGGHIRIGVKSDDNPAKTKEKVDKHRKAKKEKNSKVAKIAGSLLVREKKIMGAFKNEGKKGVDILSMSGVVKGTRITKVGANAVNNLFKKGLIRQTSLIGPSGNPRLKTTDLGKKVLEEL